MKSFVSLIFVSITIFFLSSENLLKAGGSSLQELEHAIFEKKLDDDQKTFLRETPLEDYKLFKKMVLKNINEVTNTYEYYTPEESQGLLFVQWLAFFDKHFEELKDIFSSDVKYEIPSASHFYPILSEKNFKDLENKEKKERIIQLLYQARYVLKKYIDENSSGPLKKIRDFNKKTLDKSFDFPGLKTYLHSLLSLARAECKAFSSWLELVERNFKILNLKEIFSPDFECVIPKDNLSFSVPLLKDFKNLEVDEKRKQIIYSLYHARGELEEYVTKKKGQLERVLSLDVSKKIAQNDEPYNIPSLRNYLKHLIELAAEEKKALIDQLSKLRQSLDDLKNKLSFLKGALEELKNNLIKPIKSESKKGPEQTKPEESDKAESDAASSEAKPTEPEPKDSEKQKEVSPEKGSKNLKHLTKSRPMGKAGRARPTRKPRVVKSDKQDQASEELDKKFEEYAQELKEELNKKFEEYTQELKSAWILEQKNLKDQLERHTKAYEIIKNLKTQNAIKKLTLLTQRVGEIMGKNLPDDIIKINPNELSIEIESIKNDISAKIQTYKVTVESFEKIIDLLKDKTESIESRKKDLQKESNYFGPAKLTVEDLLKIDVQKFESSVKNLEAVLKEF